MQEAPLRIAIDPGLKGGYIFFYEGVSRLSLAELPTKKILSNKEKKEKVGLDVRSLREAFCAFLESCSFQKPPQVLLVLEMPFKKPHESVLAYGSSMVLIGQLIALFELSAPDLQLLKVTPKQWTSPFDRHFLPSSLCFEKGQKKKKARAEALLACTNCFSEKDFWSPRGRLKDGVVDAAAILLWSLHFQNLKEKEKF